MLVILSLRQASRKLIPRILSKLSDAEMSISCWTSIQFLSNFRSSEAVHWRQAVERRDIWSIALHGSIWTNNYIFTLPNLPFWYAHKLQPYIFEIEASGRKKRKTFFQTGNSIIIRYQYNLILIVELPLVCAYHDVASYTCTWFPKTGLCQVPSVGHTGTHTLCVHNQGPQTTEVNFCLT